MHMPITETSRFQMYTRLIDTLGQEEASTMMEHLPPVGWADVVTIEDLRRSDLLSTTEHQHAKDLLYSHMDHVAASLRNDMAQLEASIRNDMAQLNHYCSVFGHRLTGVISRHLTPQLHHLAEQSCHRDFQDSHLAEPP